MKSLTKDELIGKVAKLEAQLFEAQKSDTEIRRALTANLNDSSATIYTWYSIFSEVGKLLSFKEEARRLDKFEENERTIRRLNRDLMDWKEKYPNVDPRPYPRYE